MAEIKLTALIVEDELPIRRFIKAAFSSQNIKLIEAVTGAEGLSLAASHRPDVLLLDLGLPDMDGIEVIRELRKSSTVPIIVLSARGKEKDKVLALESGADDYLTKPFSVGELIARIRVSLRHLRTEQGVEEPEFRFRDLRVDLEKRQVFMGKREIHLTPIEYKLLALLVRHAGKVVTQRQILLEIWGEAREEETHYLRIYIHQLREKLEDNPVRPRYLITEAGVGYRLKEE